MRILFFYRDEIELNTSGELEVVDITPAVRDFIFRWKVNSGLVNLFVPGSTGAITTIEYESGLIADFKETLKKLIPRSEDYSHNLAWQDGNAHSHLRASLIGPSLVVPVEKGELLLGTWQQIVFIELDVRPRRRRIVITVIQND